MKSIKLSLKALTSMFVGLAMLVTTPAAFAGIDVGDGLTLSGDVRFRVESDSDDNKDEDRSRERVRLRFGGKYKASDLVTLGFRLETASSSLQSPHSTLGVADGGKNASLGLGRAYIQLNLDPIVLLLGKWGSPLFNPAEFVHDSDISFEGVGAAIGGGDEIKYTAILAHHLVSENNWNGAAGDDTLLSYQGIVSGGGDIGWKVGVGGNTFNDASTEDGGSDQTHTILHAVAQVRAKEMNDIRVGGGFAQYSGDAEVDSEDKTAFMAFIRGRAGSVGLRLYYWNVGYAAALLNGAAAQDNFPFSSNFTGFHVQLDLPKLLDAVSWDLRYYTQDTKNANVSSDAGYMMTGDGRTRNRIQINFNSRF